MHVVVTIIIVLYVIGGLFWVNRTIQEVRDGVVQIRSWFHWGLNFLFWWVGFIK